MYSSRRVAAWCVASMVLVTGATAGVPAFPGAEGFGAAATGGRGRPVYVVTNLDDGGPGSLRDALSAGDRTILFNVSGTIHLKSRLKLEHPNVTIAGQSAPGDGICLSGHELFITNTSNVIVRYLRLRPGDVERAEMDALTIWNSHNVIVDHCSLSWSTDSLNDVVKGSGNVTVQWCLLAEPLNESVHVKGKHGYATGWDGRIIEMDDGTKVGGGGSYHHNLIAHAASRAPRIGYFNTGRGLIDCRNNVIYNSGPAYGGETDDFNYVANYYRPGPSTPKDHARSGVFSIWSDDSRAYITGNVYEGRGDIASDNRAAIEFRQGTNSDGTAKSPPTAEKCLVARPFDVAAVQTQPAEDAYRLVLERVGAVLPRRDAVDRRILDDVRNRTGKFINSQDEVGGWPELKSSTPPTDTDGDGIPDDWEKEHGLNPVDPADGPAIAEDGYSHLERYLNGLASTED